MSWLGARATLRLPRALSRATAAAWGLLPLLVAGAAAAHAPPSASDIRWLEVNGTERAMIRTNRGLVFELPEPRSFGIVCNEAFRVGLSEVPPLASLDDGRLLIGTYAAGVLVSSGDHCSYTEVAGPISGINTIDIARNAAGGLYAAVLPSDGSAAKLFRSSGAEDFEEQATLAGFPSAIALSSRDVSRVYVSESIPEGNVSAAALSVSEDGGREFTARPIELDPSELRVFALAVDPEVPTRVFVRTQSRDGVTPERLLLSEDAGASFETVLTAPGPLTVHAEGEAVWAGTALGIYRSSDGGRTFAPFGPAYVTRIGCLARHGGALYACGYIEPQLAYGVLESKDDGATFDWFLRFPDVAQRIACAPDSDEGRLCAAAFRDWSVEQGLTPDPSSDPMGAAGSGTGNPSTPTAGNGGAAGSVDAGVRADAARRGERAKGCRLAGQAGSAGAGFALIVIASLAVCRRWPSRPARPASRLEGAS